MATPMTSDADTLPLSPGEIEALKVEYEQLREEHSLFAERPAPPVDDQTAAWLHTVAEIGRADFRGV